MKTVLYFLGIALVIVAVVILTPWKVPNVTPDPHPAVDYEQAVLRVEALGARKPPDMNPLCRLQFMTHGKKVELAIIFGARVHQLSPAILGFGAEVL
jgi:hypothetical protein